MTPTSTGTVPDLAQWHRVAEAAVTAPSVHNTQPWLLRVTDAGLEVHADLARRLRHVDPLGRDLALSVGAAVECAVVAVEALGWRAEVLLEPNGRGDSLCALVGAGEAAVPDPTRADLAAALPRRHTQRGVLAPVALTDAALADLRRAALRAGGWVSLLGPATAAAVIDGVDAAGRGGRGRPVPAGRAGAVGPPGPGPG